MVTSGIVATNDEGGQDSSEWWRSLLGYFQAHLAVIVRFPVRRMPLVRLSCPHGGQTRSLNIIPPFQLELKIYSAHLPPNAAPVCPP